MRHLCTHYPDLTKAYILHYLLHILYFLGGEKKTMSFGRSPHVLPFLPHPSIPTLTLLQSTENTQDKRWQRFQDSPSSCHSPRVSAKFPHYFLLTAIPTVLFIT